MQTIQQPSSQHLPSQNATPSFDYQQTVEDFLNHCHLSQYLDIFLIEGFDSITSLLEITEEDMIFMNVKRGHRRLLQREIATAKGVPRDQPLITNIMSAKYPADVHQAPIKSPLISTDNNNNPISYATTTTTTNINPNPLMGYESIPTGLTSPCSMNSGIGSRSSNAGSGGSSSNSSTFGTMNTLQSRFPSGSGNTNGSFSTVDSNNSSGTDINSTKNSNKINQTINDNRSFSGSSNDDDDSVDTNESAPTTTKRKYRRHAKPDRNAPIKPPSAYIMFSNDARAELKNQNLSFAELAKIVGDQWKNLSHVEKQSYERMAMRAKDEYLAALEQYRQTQQYSRYQEYLNDFKAKQDAANRMIGRARKRAKQASPGSGSIADSSSNGNSNGSGSSGSGSADAYGDKDSVIRRQRKPSTEGIDSSMENNQQDYDAEKSIDHTNQLRPIHHHRQGSNAPPPQPPQSSDSGYTSQTYYQPRPNDSNSPQYNRHRSNQIMRGMLPVEFVHISPSSEQTQQ